MGTHFNMKPNEVRADHFLVHPDTALKLGLPNRGNSVLRFGMQSHPAIVELTEEAEKNEFVISQNLIDRLGIPNSCRYEMTAKRNEVILGPFIGILMDEGRISRLSDSRYPPFMRYAHRYNQIGGAIIAFSLSGINFEQSTINGYIYNPRDKHWSKGIFCYPASLFKRARIPEKAERLLGAVIGEKRIFNSPNLNKWQMHMLLSGIPEIWGHLPDSMLYELPANLDHFLNIHLQIYIKPVSGSNGTGVIKLSKHNDGILAMYRRKRENCRNLFKTAAEFHRFLMNENKNEVFILQKALMLISLGGRLVDFRLNLVKNQSGKWQDIGMFARYGANESVISNMSAGGRAKYADKAIKEMLNLSSTKADSYRKHMHLIGMKVVKSLEGNGGSYGNVGVDLGIDVNGKIWIIEVNTVDPGFAMFESEGKFNNMLYAKRLAGFAEE